ncbi:MAG: cytochrome c biogenesis protein CcsA [Akkermansia sp.]|nr:cytochrome c biogenesis protein CcsA [Akkermansia sp.]
MSVFLIHYLPFLLLTLYAAAATSFLRERVRGAGALYTIAWGGSLLLFVCNWTAAQAPPFGNMHHVMCLVPLLMGPAYLYSAKAQGHGWLLPHYAAACILALIGAMCMPFQTSWRQMPALQSPWFVPHVTAYIVSYGLLTVAAFLALSACWSRHREARLTRAAHDTVKLAFPLLSFGLWSGAIWADAAWSGYWAWDVKEVWSLITWALYLGYFHLAHTGASPHVRRLLLLAAFAALIVTFLVVNLMPGMESVHSYAQ